MFRPTLRTRVGPRVGPRTGPRDGHCRDPGRAAFFGKLGPEMDIGQDPRWAMDDLIYPMEPDGERRTRDGHPIMHDISCSFGTLGPEMGSDVIFWVYLNGPPSPLPRTCLRDSMF